MRYLTPQTQPRLVVVESEKEKNALKTRSSDTRVIEKEVSLAEEYDPSLYIVALDQSK